MSTDFCAGYLSGAIGIVIGNPLDLIKVRLQAGQSSIGTAPRDFKNQFETTSSLVRGEPRIVWRPALSCSYLYLGAAAPILGYGALNAILFVAYNRTLMYLAQPAVTDPTNPVGVPLYQVWFAGAVGGLASWVVSSPTELVKCRAQLSSRDAVSSWSVTKDILRRQGPKGLYFGGGVTSIRDSVGYGF